MDISIELHGTVALLRPLTEAGSDWLDDNVEAEGWQYLGNALAAEPRSVHAIINGIVDDGLNVRVEVAK